MLLLGYRISQEKQTNKSILPNNVSNWNVRTSFQNRHRISILWNVKKYRLSTEYIPHIFAGFALSVPTKVSSLSFLSWLFLVWDLKSILSIYVLPRLSYHHSFWYCSVYFFLIFLVHFFQYDLLSIFVSFHIISSLKFFLLLKCFFFPFQKFLFSKNLQETQRCKVWLDNINSHFSVIYSESLNVGLYLPVCAESSSVNKV